MLKENKVKYIRGTFHNLRRVTSISQISLHVRKEIELISSYIIESMEKYRNIFSGDVKKFIHLIS